MPQVVVVRRHTQRQYRDVHIRGGGKESDAGFKQDHGEIIELVRTSDEEIGLRLKHTEESVEDGYTREKEEMTLTTR